MRAVTPTFFERLVLDLLHAMGYGTARDDLSTSAGGADGGIDGVISLDRLGLEKVYVQAIVLIDGHQLAELMMDHGVGVSVREAFRLVSIDRQVLRQSRGPAGVVL